MTPAQSPQAVVVASPPDIAALLNGAVAEIRSALDATGATYTAGDVHEVLQEQTPDIVAGTAEQVFLLLPTYQPDEDEDEAQAKFDAVLIASLNSIETVIRRCFEEFGSVDEAAFAETWAKGEAALLSRLRSLMISMAAGGTA